MWDKMLGKGRFHGRQMKFDIVENWNNNQQKSKLIFLVECDGQYRSVTEQKTLLIRNKRLVMYWKINNNAWNGFKLMQISGSKAKNGKWNNKEHSKSKGK